jgi:hypothetical protein
MADSAQIVGPDQYLGISSDHLNHNPSAEKKFSICLYAALCPHPGGTFWRIARYKREIHIIQFFFVNNAIEAVFAMSGLGPGI